MTAPAPAPAACRCGRYAGSGVHLCHGSAGGVTKYTCLNAGSVRYYTPTWRFALAGVQPKLSVVETVACNVCWVAFEARRRSS